MTYCKQKGRASDGSYVEQGDIVTTKGGLQGEIQSFGGGSHTWVTIRTESGYTYTMDTCDVQKTSKTHD